MSLGVMHYDRRVTRWQPDAHGRLQEAALTLYGERIGALSVVAWTRTVWPGRTSVAAATDESTCVL